MTPQSIKEVCGLIAEERRPGELIGISIGSFTEGLRLSLTNAPSHVLDAITDNGYYISAEFGTVNITAEEA